MKLLNLKSFVAFSLFSLVTPLGCSVQAMDTPDFLAEEAFKENASYLFGRHLKYDYGLRRGEHEVHVLAMGIGHGFYKDVPDADFKTFVQQYANTYQRQFASQFEYKNAHYTPLGSIFGPDCLRNPWNKEQIEQAKILFHVYKDYEPAVPKITRTKETFFISLLDTVLGQDTNPNTQYFVDYYKHLFENGIDSSNDEEFLKYAYVFFQMKDPENPALHKIQPRKIDPALWLDSLASARVNDPYERLENLLKSEDNWWRLCMDYRQQRLGKTGKDYDLREPRTTSSLRAGFQYIFEHRENISYDYINTLWTIATKHRTDDINKRGQRFGCHFPETTLNFMLSFKEKFGHVATFEFTPYNKFTVIPFIFMKSPFSINPMTFDPKLQQAEQIYKATQNDENCPKHLKEMAEYVCKLLLLQHMESCGVIAENPEKASHWTKNEVTKFIDQFNLVNNNPEATFDQKLLAGIKLVQALEVTHEHEDCNARTNVVLLLNKLLMDLKLPPAMFEYPMAFDGKTAEEAIPLVIEGIENQQRH